MEHWIVRRRAESIERIALDSRDRDGAGAADVDMNCGSDGVGDETSSGSGADMSTGWQGGSSKTTSGSPCPFVCILSLFGFFTKHSLFCTHPLLFAPSLLLVVEFCHRWTLV